MPEYRIEATVWAYLCFASAEEAREWTENHTVMELLETGLASDMRIEEVE